ncbi:pectate lyase-like adhesive domain-containing protein, partial [Listeria rocourtiae]
MKKKELLKKGSSIALVATLIGSQLMTTAPFNVFAAENAAGTISTQALPYYGVTVSTWSELKAALTSAAITDIYINADITIGETTSVTNTTKNIHGNDHTLNANGKQIRLTTANTVGLIEDLRITNTDIYGLFWGSVANLEVTYKNVDHSGGQMIYLPSGHLIIDGTVTSISSTEEVYEGKDLTIMDNAIAYFATTSTARRNSPINSEAASGKLIVGNNANLITRSKAASIYGGTNFTLINYGNMDLKSDNFQAIHLAAGSSMYFQPGSVLKAVAGDPVEEAVEATTGNIFVEAGATFEVESNGTQGAVITGDTFKLAQGSNFSITNFNSAGSALGSYASPVNVILQSGQGVSTWDRGTVTNPMPTATYPGVINAQFTLSGYLKSVSQTKLVSNNALFNSRYNTGATGKIVGGSFSSKAIGQTTINKLDTDSTLATGTAEPKADVVIKVGSTIIGQGKAGDDGKYSITIPKQAVGANVTATATWNSQTSSATTVVQKGTADQDAARTAVDALFTDATKTGIKATTDQAAIDAAQALVNKVQDPTVKSGLTKRY